MTEGNAGIVDVSEYQRHELSPIEGRLFSTLKRLYSLDENTTAERHENRLLLRDPSIPGIIGVDYSEKKEPYTFFYPDEAIAINVENGLSQQEIINLLHTLYQSFPTSASKLMSPNGIFPSLKESEELKEKGVVLQNCFINKSDDSIGKEVFNLDYLDKRMVAKIAKGIGVYAYDTVAEAIDIARLAKSLTFEDGKKFSLPFALGPMQLMPQYPEKKVTYINLREIVVEKLENETTKNIFWVSREGEVLGDIIIDPLLVSSDSPYLSNTRNELLKALSEG